MLAFSKTQIAVLNLIIEDANSEREIKILISSPYQLDSNWACQVGLEGVDSIYPEIFGADSVHALNSAMSFIGDRLRTLVKSGAKLTFGVQNKFPRHPFPIDHYFPTIPSGPYSE